MKQARSTRSSDLQQIGIHEASERLVVILGLVVGVVLCGDHFVARAARKTSPPDATTNRWVTPAARTPRLQQRFFQSAAAKAKVSYHIYTPAVYDTDKKRRFPVLYWLHGSGGGLRGLPKLVEHFDGNSPL